MIYVKILNFNKIGVLYINALFCRYYCKLLSILSGRIACKQTEILPTYYRIIFNLTKKEFSMLTWKDVINFSLNGNLDPDIRVEKTEQEWKGLLTPEQYRITRLKGTERPHSGDFCTSYEEGLYSCVCCNTMLFDSTIKFESGTGWPSFTQPIKENAVKYEKDDAFGMIRVEIMCNTCDSHLGHVFPDGPEPSGLRYCVNSESLKLEKE